LIDCASDALSIPDLQAYDNNRQLIAQYNCLYILWVILISIVQGLIHYKPNKPTNINVLELFIYN